MLGDRLQYRNDKLDKFIDKKNLPPTPQSSDGEDDEQPSRKRHCVETNCELAKVSEKKYINFTKLIVKA